jgi:arsenate reductase
MTAHWGIEDPATITGTEIERERAFNLAFRFLKNRISAFVALPIASLDQLSNRVDCARLVNKKAQHALPRKRERAFVAPDLM